MRKESYNPQRELIQGQYQRVIDQMRSKPSVAVEDRVALIGALSFLGRLEEAQQVWKAFEKSIKGEERFKARFYLGIALTRTSKFRAARSLFKANLDEAVSNTEQAYAFQGVGFYSYFRGNFSSALKWSKCSLGKAVKAKEYYIEFLAMDLLGHAIVQTGLRSQGLRLMQEAGQLALTRGNSNFSAAFANARLVYEAEIGLRPESIVLELEEALNHPKLADSYTAANLILELSRQLTLRGQFEKAKNLLNREASRIYSYGNKRQEVMLQLRLAEVSGHQGDFHFMLHLLQSAKRTVAVLADKAFEIRLLGLYLKIPQQIAMTDMTLERERLVELSKEHSSLINRQILYRSGLGADPETPAGEDPLNDLLQLAQTDKELALQLCLERGYLGVYRKLADLAPGLNFIKILNNGSSFVLGSKEQISFHNTRLSLQQLKILESLSRGGTSKEKLIEKVWGYTYDSLRHDSLVHNAIGKLRKLLGSETHWILTTDYGWALAPQVQLLLGLAPSSNPVETLIRPQNLVYDELLNVRQLKALKTVPIDMGWSVSTYKQYFKISTMTAFRDLSHLHEKGLMLRMGRGRACRYLLRKDLEV